MTESIYGEDWRAATGWEDIRTALKEGLEVRDSDGDRIVAVQPNAGMYSWVNDSMSETLTQRTLDVTRIRIKEGAPDIDLDAYRQAVASLKGGRIEWGVRDNNAQSTSVTEGFIDRADCEDWIRRNPMNFGPGDFDVVTRIVTPWEKA